jgi:hypothetical protein
MFFLSGYMLDTYLKQKEDMKKMSELKQEMSRFINQQTHVFSTSGMMYYAHLNAQYTTLYQTYTKVSEWDIL